MCFDLKFQSQNELFPTAAREVIQGQPEPEGDLGYLTRVTLLPVKSQRSHAKGQIITFKT